MTKSSSQMEAGSVKKKVVFINYVTNTYVKPPENTDVKHGVSKCPLVTDCPFGPINEKVCACVCVFTHGTLWWVSFPKM